MARITFCACGIGVLDSRQAWEPAFTALSADPYAPDLVERAEDVSGPDNRHGARARQMPKIAPSRAHRSSGICFITMHGARAATTAADPANTKG
ncbi:MAG: hypothetical protein WA184_13330, partial [Stellaceae bacterium]